MNGFKILIPKPLREYICVVLKCWVIWCSNHLTSIHGFSLWFNPLLTLKKKYLLQGVACSMQQFSYCLGQIYHLLPESTLLAALPIVCSTLKGKPLRPSLSLSQGIELGTGHATQVFNGYMNLSCKFPGGVWFFTSSKKDPGSKRVHDLSPPLGNSRTRGENGNICFQTTLSLASLQRDPNFSYLSSFCNTERTAHLAAFRDYF